MTVWINNPFDFLPGEGARLQRYGLLAQAFAQAGHRVIWWSSDWSHAEKRRREVAVGSSSWQSAATFAKATAARGASDRTPVQIRLIKTMAYFKNVGVRRLVSHWLYAKRWEREALRCDPADRPDLIICSAPPLSTGWVMRSLCKYFACKGVVDVMDLWPETFERVVPAWLLWPLRWLAKRVYQGADAISAVGDSYLEVVRQRTEVGGQRSEKPMYRCYHGIEGAVLKCEPASLGATPSQGSSKVLKLREGMPTADCQLPTANLRLVYVGNMGRGYDLETLVRAVVELVNEGVPIALDLAGGGEQEPTLQKLAHATQSITFQGVVTGEALRALLEQADAGVVPMFPSTHVAVPYKLADYTAAGLPVVNSLTGETAQLLEQYACGWSYEAGSVASLKQALHAVVELKQRDAGAFEARGGHARRLAEECFDAARIYPAFVASLLALRGSNDVLLRLLSGRNGVVKS